MMRTDSLHRIASTTKLFVTTAAMRLYEQAEAPRRAPAIEDLMRHTAGFTY